MKSGVLGVSTHQISLFKYLINAKYEGTLENVKAYSIAVDGFGRPDDFDSSTDSIVRVEMFRLRANLREFNQKATKFQLDLPRASYHIQVKPIPQHPAGGAEMEARLKEKAPDKFARFAMMVGVIVSVGIGGFFMGRITEHGNNISNCSDTLPNVAITNKSQSYDLELYIDQILRGAASQFSHVKIVDDIKNCHASAAPGYEIQYTIFQDATTYRTALSVSLEDDGQLIGSQNISGNLKTEIFDADVIRDELYYNLVTATNNWLMPNGLIHKNAVSFPWKDQDKFTDYSCLAIMYDSFVSDSSEDYKNSLNCLETSYKNGTPLLDNWGGLATSYIEQLQGVRPRTVSDPELEAKNILNKIGGQWDQHVETTIAKIFYEAERQDFNSQRLRDTLLTSERTNSSNPITLMEVAKHAGFRLGDWDYAKRVSDEVKLIQSERDNSVYLIDAAYALQFETPAQAVKACNKTYSENSMLSNLLINACAIRGQDPVWTERSDANLSRLGLETSQAKINFIKSRNFDEDFKMYLIKIWQK